MIRTVTRNGKRRLVIHFSYVDKTGAPQEYRRDATYQTMVAARSEEKRLRAVASATGSPTVRTDSPTWAAFVSGTFEPLFMPAFRESTRVRYRALLRSYPWDAKRLTEITHMMMLAFGTSLLKRGVNPRGHENLARTVFRTAVESGALESAPEVPRQGKSGKKLPDAPDESEVRAMLKASVGHWIRPAIALAAYAGLRQGEVRALEVRDVDLNRGVINVRRALSETELTTPKSGNERVIPIAPQLRACLEPVMAGKFPMSRVVVNFEGGTPSRQEVLRTLKKATGTKRSFHSLRHYFISRGVRLGISVEVMRLMAGHSSIGVTARYTHAAAGELHTAMARMGREEEET
jgi:integrase